MRAAIYCRYSTNLQNEHSIAHQAALCRRYAERHGWDVIEVYADPALSGASVMNRPGLQRLLQDAKSGRFDVVVTEAVNRLSRNMGDSARIFESLSFHKVELHAVNMGQMTALHLGILATVSQAQLADVASHTRRTLEALAREGRIPAGIAYGYEAVPGPAGEKGHRRVKQEEAQVVIRIFQAFTAGQSPRHIAHQLNREGIPGPRGQWNESTIRGQPGRGNGILNNALYVGSLVWNRTRYAKDPETRKRVCRVNPREEWVTTELPDLRIIDDELWQRAKAAQKEISERMSRNNDGNALNQAHRQKYVLSRRLVCAHCGGSYTMMGKDRYGCSSRRRTGICPNAKTIRRQEAEDRVLAALKEKMLDNDRITAFTEAWANEAREMADVRNGSRTAAEKALKQVERNLGNVMKAIEEGLHTPSTKERLLELEAEKAKLMETLVEEPAEQVVLPSSAELAALYRRYIANLRALLDDPAFRDEAIAIVQSLIDRVEVGTDGNTGRATLTVYGEITRMLGAAVDAEGGTKKARRAVAAGPQTSVVAGAGFEPATFRL